MEYKLESAIKLVQKIIICLELGKDGVDPETGKHYRKANYWRRTVSSRDSLYWLGNAHFGIAYSLEKGKGPVALAAGNLEGVAFLRSIFGNSVPISLTQKKGQGAKAIDAASVEAAVKQAKEAIAE